MTKERKFLAYLDCEGFHYIVDITTYERKKLLADIKGSLAEPPFNLNNILLKARFSPQKNPEIWIFTGAEGVTGEFLTELSKEKPNEFLDIIKENGKCVFKNPEGKNELL